MTTQVKNLCSPRTGSEVANQFIITTDKGEYFQSYGSVIAFIPVSGKTQLDEKFWNYSKTTSKYRNVFLSMTTQAIKSAVDSGEIVLTNLNG